jgi:hypothetical protein
MSCSINFGQLIFFKPYVLTKKDLLFQNLHILGR